MASCDDDDDEWEERVGVWLENQRVSHNSRGQTAEELNEVLVTMGRGRHFKR